MNWLENKYIMLLSNRLEGFKKRQSNLFNFRCPYCLDSQQKKNKMRGYLYNRKGAFSFYCHNCGEAHKFPRFLKDTDQNLYQEFLLESMTEQNKKPVNNDPLPIKREIPPDIFKDLKRLSDLNVEHLAKKFAIQRRIPGKFHSKLFYCPTYRTFVNNLIPDKLKGPDGPRLIIPFHNRAGEVKAFTGRALDDDSFRYSMIALDDSQDRAFNLHELDPNRRYYVVEGAIDSMFIDNAIGVGGSDMVGALRRLDINKENAVFVFDNEPRNKEILKKMNQAIKNGFQICIWPDHIKAKDINDMILEGLTSSEIQYIIDTHTHSGIKAELEFTTWKRT